MKLKNYWNRFWTLDRHHAAGFTLVELIVVIAILAILAGVGIPVYSGYITKANKQVDQTLVSDIVRAFEVAQYAEKQDTFADKVGVIGYVTLTDSETDKSTAKGIDAATTEFVQKAMINAFGANYTDMVLSYDDWSDATLITAINGVDDEYLSAINQSTYINSIGTENLLGDVQNCATAFSGFLTQLSNGDNEAAVDVLNKYLGDNKADSEFMEYIDEFTGGDYSKANSDVLANATVFGIAGQVVGNEASVVDTFNNMLDPTTGKYKTLDMGTVASTNGLYTVATWYAATEAYVAAIGDPDVTAEFKKIDMSSSDAGTILNNMNLFADYLSGKITPGSATYDADINSALGAYYMAGGPARDACAYVGIMSTVSGISDDYKNDSTMMNDGSLFTNGNVMSRVNSMVSVVSLSDAVAGDSIASAILNGTYNGSAILVAINRDINGNITCVITPSTVKAIN